MTTDHLKGRKTRLLLHVVHVEALSVFCAIWEIKVNVISSFFDHQATQNGWQTGQQATTGSCSKIMRSEVSSERSELSIWKIPKRKAGSLKDQEENPFYTAWLMARPEKQRYKNLVLNFSVSVTAYISIFMYTTTASSWSHYHLLQSHQVQ